MKKEISSFNNKYSLCSVFFATTTSFGHRFCEKRIGRFLSVKLDQALKTTHFHVYIVCSKMELWASFRGHNIQKTRPNRVSPAEPVGLAKTPNHHHD